MIYSLEIGSVLETLLGGSKKMENIMTKRSLRKFFIGAVILGIGLGLQMNANAGTFPVAVSVAPSNTLSLTAGAINAAQQSILLNTYLLTSTDVTGYLIAAINRGVKVEILMEGEPYGGIPSVENAPVSQIIYAMNAHPGNRFVEMVTPGNGTPRRFTYDHAKYMVIDNSLLLVGSDNYTHTSEPSDPSTTKGDRGWEVLIQDAQPAQWFAQVFASDSNPSEPDIRNMLNYSSPSYAGMELASYVNLTGTSGGGHHHQPTPTPVNPGPSLPTNAVTVLPQLPNNPVFEATDGQLIVSPNNSTQGLIGLINSAQRSIDIEQLEFAYYWRASANDPSTAGNSISPVVAAVEAAAQRGVQVRILLNPDSTGSNATPTPNGQSSSQTNAQAVSLLNSFAQTHGYPLQARIADVNAMNVQYIHNKGVIIDSMTTLVSSINWSQNAIQNNREAAVALTSPGLSGYYESVFNQDWNQSAN